VCATAANSIGIIMAFLCCEFRPVLVIFFSAERSLNANGECADWGGISGLYSGVLRLGRFRPGLFIRKTRNVARCIDSINECREDGFRGTDERISKVGCEYYHSI
jgi:hypothetical protein